MNDLYHPVVQNGRLSRRLKESLLVAASDARMCSYCVGGYSLFAVGVTCLPQGPSHSQADPP
jgi:hypothetical protein